MIKNKKHPIQHYVAKMFIRRFMNGRSKLYVLDVDSLDIQPGTLKESFGEKKLWSDDTEQKLNKIETSLNFILQSFDKIEIKKQRKHKCTIWTIEDPHQREIIIKMALLQPNLLNDLKDGAMFEENILHILGNEYSKYKDDVFFVKLYEEHCNGKFLITDYLGQSILELLDVTIANSIEDIKTGNIKHLEDRLPYYFVTGEYEFFFVGTKEKLQNFLESLRRPVIFKHDSGKEYKLEVRQIDKFELTAFNFNQISSQESQCEVGSYDKDYLEIIKNELPNILSRKIMWRKTSARDNTRVELDMPKEGN